MRYVLAVAGALVLVGCNGHPIYSEVGGFQSGGHMTCESFPSREAAQHYLDHHGRDYKNLDPDGDGRACEWMG